MLVALVMPHGAQAATYSPSMSTQQQIQYLYARVAELQAMLKVLQGMTNGTSISSQLSVQTDSVRLLNRSTIEMNGTVMFKQSGDAQMWFKYGQTTSLSQKTKYQSLSNKRLGSSYDFSIDTSNLVKNKKYYYQAVAEGDDGRMVVGATKSFTYTGSNSSSNDDDDDNDDNDSNDTEPDVTTGDASDITDNEAELEGEVDMNDFDNGDVFFVYGEDEEMVSDAADENEYGDINESSDDLQKIMIVTSFDGNDTLTKSISDLQDDTEIYYRLCVSFSDEDDDETLVCGDVESFMTETQ